MSDVREIHGCMSVSSNSLTLTESLDGDGVLIEASSTTARKFSAASCRHLARALYRLARRIEARAAGAGAA